MHACLVEGVKLLGNLLKADPQRANVTELPLVSRRGIKLILSPYYIIQGRCRGWDELCNELVLLQYEADVHGYDTQGKTRDNHDWDNLHKA